MSLVTIARRLPQELQFPMLEFAEAIEEDLRAQLAVRREDFDVLQAAVHEVADSQHRSEQRLDRLETVVVELAEAQKRTELRVEELAEAQKRTELRVEELAEAQKRTELRVEELAEAQKRTELRVEELAEAQKRTELRVEELAEAQKRTELRVEELAEAQKRTELRVEELAEAQKRTELRLDHLERVVAELAEAQKRTEQALADLIVTVQQLIQRVDRMQIRLDGLIGDNLERRYRERAYAYFGRVLRQVQTIPWIEVEERLEERLSEKEVDDVRLLDLLVRGRPRDAAVSDHLWLAVEVSKVVDRVDVERALRRAAMLRKAGFLAIPVAAGEEQTLGSDDAARDTGVVLVQDGAMQFWDEALQRVRPA